MKNYPAQSELRELFSYDPKGFLIWKPRPASDFKEGWIARCLNKRVAGKRAGCLEKNGYISIRINGISYQGHTLIWIYHHGPMPAGLTVDHDNGVSHDNRIENFKLATKAQQSQNKKMHRNNKSGYMNVAWSANDRKWRVSLRCNGKVHFIGLYKDVHEAGRAAAEKRQALGFHSRHGAPMPSAAELTASHIPMYRKRRAASG